MYTDRGDAFPDTCICISVLFGDGTEVLFLFY